MLDIDLLTRARERRRSASARRGRARGLRKRMTLSAALTQRGRRTGSRPTRRAPSTCSNRSCARRCASAASARSASRGSCARGSRPRATPRRPRAARGAAAASSSRPRRWGSETLAAAPGGARLLEAMGKQARRRRAVIPDLGASRPAAPASCSAVAGAPAEPRRSRRRAAARRARGAGARPRVRELAAAANRAFDSDPRAKYPRARARAHGRAGRRARRGARGGGRDGRRRRAAARGARPSSRPTTRPGFCARAAAGSGTCPASPSSSSCVAPRDAPRAAAARDDARRRGRRASLASAKGGPTFDAVVPCCADDGMRARRRAARAEVGRARCCRRSTCSHDARRGAAPHPAAHDAGRARRAARDAGVRTCRLQPPNARGRPDVAADFTVATASPSAQCT